jgi:hypothetical protein
MPRVRSKSQRQHVVQNDAGKIAAALKGAHGERMPKFIAPCLATLRDKVPMGDQWASRNQIRRLSVAAAQARKRCSLLHQTRP